MKKLLFLLATLISLTAFGQVPANGVGEVFILEPAVSQRVHVSDSVQLSATLVTNHAVSGITWIQVAGPTVKISPTTNYFTGAVATGAFWLQGLAPGVYAFKAVGLASTGTTNSVIDSLTVVPDPVVPICPVIPAPRTVVSAQITINGTVFTIPLVGIPVKYSDGSTQ